MKLSKFEQMVTIILCDIAEKVGVDNSLNWGLVREAVYSGNTWALEEEYPGIFADQKEPDLVSEVINILDMWSFIEEASEERFPGFDGNREAEHASVARFFTEQMKRFERFDGRATTGVLGLDGYRRMYDVFEPIRAELGTRTPIALTGDEVERILAERVHPENR